MNLPPIRTYRFKLVDYQGEPTLVQAKPGEEATHTFTTRTPHDRLTMGLLSDQDEIIALDDDSHIGAITDALVMLDSIDQVIIIEKVVTHYEP